MKKTGKILFALLLLCCSSKNFSQTVSTVDYLSKQYQDCLDRGKYMLGCSKQFYFQMDSLLNVVYTNLRSTLTKEQQLVITRAQQQWLTQRDAHFKQTLAKFKKANPGHSPYGSAIGAQDDAMFMYDENAEFVKKRVLSLGKLLVNNKTQ